MREHFNDPIIVAGAGPVGCVLTYMLTKNDIPVVLLEKEANLVEDLRASTFHPPTLDMLEDLGLVGDLLAQGLIAPVFQFRDRRSQRYAEFDLGVLADETRHPYRAQVEQFRLTNLICDRLKKESGYNILFEHEVVDVQQDNSGVDVFINTADGKTQIRGSYVVGTDGGSSKIRLSLGIEFPGFTYPEKFIVVSTSYPLEQYLKNLSYVSYVADPDEWLTIIRCNNLWRLSFPADPERDDKTLLSDGNVQGLLKGLVDTGQDYEIGHKSIYAVNQRVAATYRKNRVLLAGDAAHVNNPLGGMGMNGGIHDAVNLGEKLVEMSKGASADLLDAYDRQRRLIATKFVQEQTIKNKEELENKNPQQFENKLNGLIETANDRETAKAYLMVTSMINIVRESYAIQ